MSDNTDIKYVVTAADFESENIKVFGICTSLEEAERINALAKHIIIQKLDDALGRGLSHSPFYIIEELRICRVYLKPKHWWNKHRLIAIIKLSEINQ